MFARLWTSFRLLLGRIFDFYFVCFIIIDFRHANVTRVQTVDCFLNLCLLLLRDDADGLFLRGGLGESFFAPVGPGILLRCWHKVWRLSSVSPGLILVTAFHIWLVDVGNIFGASYWWIILGLLLRLRDAFIRVIVDDVDSTEGLIHICAPYRFHRGVLSLVCDFVL